MEAEIQLKINKPKNFEDSKTQPDNNNSEPEELTYQQQLDKAYPPVMNMSAADRQCRETLFLMKDFGLDKFGVNLQVLQQF